MDLPEIKRIKGRIKELRFDWGFIEGEDGKDYFLYCKSMDPNSCNFKSLRFKDEVEFVPTVSSRGPRAELCSRILKPEAN